MNTQTRNNEKGFTMVELIIVVAIMGIIGALLVPLTTDVSTIKTLQRTIDAYNAQPQATYISDQDSIADIETLLKGAKLLSSTVELQTGGLVKTEGGRVRLKLVTGTVEKSIIDMAKGLDGTDQMRNWLAIDDDDLSTSTTTTPPTT